MKGQARKTSEFSSKAYVPGLRLVTHAVLRQADRENDDTPWQSLLTCR